MRISVGLICFLLISGPIAAHADDGNEYYHMSTQQLQAIDSSQLSKKELKALKKAIKSRAEADAMYGDILEDGKFRIQHVVELPGQNASNMYTAASEWMANSNNLYDVLGGYQAGQSVLNSAIFGQNKTNNFPAIIANYKQQAAVTREQEGELLYAHIVTLVENAKGFTNNIRSMFYEANLKIQFKDNRYRITVQDVHWSNWNSGTGEKFPIYPGKKHAARGCSTEGTIEDLISCPKGKEHAYKSIMSYVEHLNSKLQDLNEKISAVSESVDDDW